ncbi:hypothetical protein [Cellulomonas carbonis]|uniref:hypothetical protein n=1 Tax=Cellulomonas carbonis TaxID=1386092 RepID=UPI00166CA385|nr:hypothetical protein [Cellulomonas carbonis]GGC17947.1 hypothetical protein GCM10010972_33990 [Cellulomonas carbonis]
MATRGLSVEDAERQARALLDARISSVRAVVAARQRLADLREQVGQAEREDVRLYNAAITDGWTADELRRLGIPEPEKKARVRRRATAARRAGDTTDTPSTPTPAEDSPDGEQH